MAVVSEVARRLLEQPVLAHLATLMKDGSPQVSPVWIDFDGRYVLVNSEDKRQKVRNVRRDPRVALSILDPSNPNGRLMMRGRVVEVTEEGAADHIDKLARKYRGENAYQRTPGERRVILKILPQSIRVSARWA